MIETRDLITGVTLLLGIVGVFTGFTQLADRGWWRRPLTNQVIYGMAIAAAGVVAMHIGFTRWLGQEIVWLHIFDLNSLWTLGIRTAALALTVQAAIRLIGGKHG